MQTATKRESWAEFLDYGEPVYRPKVFKIQVKQYGLRKFVRVNTRRNSKKSQ